MKTDGTLVLTHDHSADGRGLDLERASRVLQYVHRAWRRPVTLQTVDSRGSAHELRAGS
jgi:stage V sporulation protein R